MVAWIQFAMTDTETLNWIERNASKLGMDPDWKGSIFDERGMADTSKPDIEFTDIRKRVAEIASRKSTAKGAFSE